MENIQIQARRNWTNCQQVDRRTWPEIDRQEQDKFASTKKEAGDRTQTDRNRTGCERVDRSR